MRILAIAVVATAALLTGTAPPPASDPLASAQPCLVALSVLDLDASARWYENVAGFRKLRTIDLPKQSLRIVFLERNGFQIEMIEFKRTVSYEAIRSKFANVDDRAKVQGFTKLAFRVTDLDRVAAVLKQRKAHVLFDVRTDNVTGDKWMIVQDNEGNWLQFFQVV